MITIRLVPQVAIFLNKSLPTHAARQLESGLWISKCGRLQDIQHPLNAVEGQLYGKAHTFLHRRRDGKQFLEDRLITYFRRLFRK